MEESDIKSRREGRVKFARIRSVQNAEGKNVVLARNGEIIIVDSKGEDELVY